MFLLNFIIFPLCIDKNTYRFTLNVGIENVFALCKSFIFYFNQLSKTWTLISKFLIFNIYKAITNKVI